MIATFSWVSGDIEFKSKYASVCSALRLVRYARPEVQKSRACIAAKAWKESRFEKQHNIMVMFKNSNFNRKQELQAVWLIEHRTVTSFTEMIQAGKLQL